MERKRSGIGIAAGILFGISFLYDAVWDIIFAVNYPSVYMDMHGTFWWIEQTAKTCVSVFLIISLFRERRSRLLLASHIINTVLNLSYIVNMLRDGSHISAADLMMVGSLILRTVMVVYICIPSLREKAGWTGKLRFILPVLTCIARIVHDTHYLNMYLEQFEYHPLLGTFQILLFVIFNVIDIVSVFLFCLWLTEPVRIKKEKLQITEQ